MFQALAIDLGAGSGRVIRGTLDQGKLSLDEVVRFDNESVKKNGHLRWQIDSFRNLLLETVKKECEGGQISSVGVDTWGVDYVLLDEHDNLLDDPICYRDHRTDHVMAEFLARIPAEKLYSLTGIQIQNFNTLFQLYAQKKENPDLLKRAKTLLFMPDYLNFLLCGVRRNESTILSTSQLVDLSTGNLSEELLDQVGMTSAQFPEKVMPGSILGKTFGGAKVIAVGSHDTASAVAAVPAADTDFVYLASGTWCLMGVESDTPNLSEVARNNNFTNEGGVRGDFRLLKNLMGLWMVRGIRNSLPVRYSYAELEHLAEQADPTCIVDANDSSFFNPDSMCQAIVDYALKTDQLPPQTPGEFVRCALESLALLYKNTLDNLREMQGKPYSKIHLLGGGVKDSLMCRLTAEATGAELIAGPVEGAVIGNFIVQAIACGAVKNLTEGRKIVANSFPVKSYFPKGCRS